MKRSCGGTLSAMVVLIVVVALLLPTSYAKTLSEEEYFYGVPPNRPMGKERKGGCASFGHSCFGGHGKRAPPPLDGPASNQITLDPLDLQTVQLFRQLCTLEPEQYLRLAPVFRRLAENYIAEAEEPLPRK